MTVKADGSEMHRNTFFSCSFIQIGSSASIFFFQGVDLIEKPKFGDQNFHLRNPLKNMPHKMTFSSRLSFFNSSI